MIEKVSLDLKLTHEWLEPLLPMLNEVREFHITSYSLSIWSLFSKHSF